MDSDDPIARLWLTAMRAELDAVVLRFEAQLKQHVSLVSGARREEIDALEQQLAAFAARVKESDEEAARLRALHDEAARELTTVRAQLAAARTAHETLQRAHAELQGRVDSLDEQFVAERRFVAALTAVAGSLLFDVAQLALGQTVEPTPACMSAIKTRKPDALLASFVRERGRTVTRYPLSADERAALAALAEASGCALVEVSPGTRFSSASMEKAATRAEPAEEDHVLECLMPGLRLADSQGAVVHPRVVVATG